MATGVKVVVVSNRLPAYMAQLQKGIANEIEKGARQIEAGAKSQVPVDTGTLRRSITTQMSNGGLTATVAAGTDYALFVERGTRRMGARPYLIPAFEREVPRMIAAIRGVLGRIG